MPYYTVSYGVDKKNGKNVGNSYSEYLSRICCAENMNLKGIVCTDWGITRIRRRRLRDLEAAATACRI